MSEPAMLPAFMEHLPWPLNLWMTGVVMGLISWVITLKIFVSSHEFNTYRIYVAETYMTRSETQEHIKTLNSHLSAMQQQLQQMQQVLYKWLP